MTREVEKETRILPKSGRVMVKPIIRQTWLHPGHDGEFRFTGTFETIVPQLMQGQIINSGLSKEEEKEFEKELNLKEGSLSIYNRDFWGTFRIPITGKGLILDLSVARQRLEYAILIAHQHIANSEAEILDSPYARYYMTSDEEENKVKGATTKTRREAYKIFSNMSYEDMISLHNILSPGKRLSKESNIDLVSAAVEKIVIDQPQVFLSTLQDGTFKMKSFIEQCVQAKILERNGTKYSIKGGEIIGRSLSQAIEWLENPNNNDDLVDIKAKLEVTNNLK